MSSERTRIEREFDAAAIRRLKESSRSDITIGGAELAGQAIAEGLVDECHLFLGPVLVGGGKRATAVSMPSSSWWTSAAFAAASYTSITVYEPRATARACATDLWGLH